MWYESEPSPTYHNLRNSSYSIKLSYTTDSSTPQVNLPRLGPTIAPTGLSTASATPPCTAHIWDTRPPFPIWSPAASWCTTRWGGYQRLPLPPPLLFTTTIHLTRAFQPSPWSVAPPGGGNPPGPWASTLSPPSYRCRTRAPTAPPPYTSTPGPILLLLSFPSPPLPFPTASEFSAVFGRQYPNRCYCRQLSVLDTENLPEVVGSPHLSETRPYLPRSSVVGSHV